MLSGWATAQGYLYEQGAAQEFGAYPLVVSQVVAAIGDLAVANGAALDATGIIPVSAFGPAGSATFVIEIEDGAKVTYSWSTGILKAWSGLEQRVALLGAPRQAYEFTTILNDAQARAILSSLVGNAAQAQPFLVGLSYEELTVSADGSGTTVPVWSTSRADWVIPGQRVVILGRDGSVASGFIQTSSDTSITVDHDVSAVARNGARIMPAMAIYLDAQQQLARYAVNAGTWQLTARAALFGFAGSMTMGIGATVNSFVSMPLWDRGVVVNGTVAHPLDSGAELVDLGGIVDNVAEYGVSDWGRALAIASPRQDDFQWLKAFLATVRGRQVAFLVATCCPDLVPVGDASSGTLKVSSDATYATTWFTSLAHRRLRLLMTNGTIAYRTVTTAVDNGDGTQSLGLDSAATGTIAMCSFLETCRLESDDAPVTFAGPTMSCSMMAHVVQQ